MPILLVGPKALWPTQSKPWVVHGPPGFTLQYPHEPRLVVIHGRPGPLTRPRFTAGQQATTTGRQRRRLAGDLDPGPSTEKTTWQLGTSRPTRRFTWCCHRVGSYFSNGAAGGIQRTFETLNERPYFRFLTPWRPLLPYGHSYKACVLSRHL